MVIRRPADIFFSGIKTQPVSWQEEHGRHSVSVQITSWQEDRQVRPSEVCLHAPQWYIVRLFLHLLTHLSFHKHTYNIFLLILFVKSQYRGQTTVMNLAEVTHVEKVSYLSWRCQYLHWLYVLQSRMHCCLCRHCWFFWLKALKVRQSFLSYKTFSLPYSCWTAAMCHM